MVSLVGHILPVKRTLLFTRLITPRARPLLHTAAVTSIVFSRYGTQSGSTHSDTHTHNIRCSTSVIVPRPSGFCPSHGAPLAGLSPKVCFGVTKVLYPRHPSPHFSPPEISLLKRPGRGGTHSIPHSGESSTGATACVRGLIMRTEEESQVSPLRPRRACP